MGVDGFANGVVLLGVPAALLVPLVVEGLKRLGLPTRWATPAAVLAGGVVAALAEAVDIWPALDPLVRVLLAAVIFGFAASGVYSQAAQRRGDGRPAPGNE
jgi:hypothetical protein